VKWLIMSIVVALAAVVAANALLLVYGANRNDPVGRLSPIVETPLNLTPKQPVPHVTTTPLRAGREDD
jgi:hypothetical protein